MAVRIRIQRKGGSHGFRSLASGVREEEGKDSFYCSPTTSIIVATPLEELLK